MPRTQIPTPARVSDRWALAAQVAALGVGLWLTVPTEFARLREALQSKAGLWDWIFEINLDTTLPFLLLLIVPAVWFVRRRGGPADVGAKVRTGVKKTSPPADRVAWAMAFACALTSIAVSAWIASRNIGGDGGVRFGDLPPTYHDEFSYLFQAKTFLAGRFSFPSSPRMPELFDQMHVINEGRFASRYFPGVGLWIAPFLAIGNPYWGQWLAGGLTSFFIFWTGRELAGNRVGLAAGLLTAISPGMSLFSNLLLSHHPTMAALSLFLFAFVRFMRTERKGDAFAAGCGLSFAMLCRPMTAGGFGLPFGLWFLWRLVQPRRAKEPHATPTDGRPWAGVVALAAPILAGGIFMFFYDRAITGNGFLTPYQVYTDTYTPRHVYGFNNVLRGEQHLGPKVIDNYDRWADNLTPTLAVENVEKRAAACARWTLGLVLLAMASTVFVLAVMWRADRRWRFVAGSVLAMHAVHVPYWFVGIMEWHYVFETGPLLLLIYAVTSQFLFDWWRKAGRLLMPAWWGGLLASALVTNWVPFDPIWTYSWMDRAVEMETVYARVRYQGLKQLIEQHVTSRPALVLIEADPADRSIDYVYNDPDLSAPVLRGRYRPGKTDLAKVHAAFPDRTLYLFRVNSKQLLRLTQ